MMKAYAQSLAAGLMIGMIYSLIGVRSPAPPVIALLGLAGIVAGERAAPFIGRLLHSTLTVAEKQA
jgi:XapX domain-containing protein